MVITQLHLCPCYVHYLDYHIQHILLEKHFYFVFLFKI